MKKIFPTLIVIFVFGFVITTGFLIVKTGLTSDTSNAKLIEAFIDNPTSTAMSSMVGFTHLADAYAEVTAKPQAPESLDAYYLQPLPTSSASSASTTNQQTIDVAIAQMINAQMAAQH